MLAENRYDSLIQYYAEQAGFTGRDWKRLKAQIKAESAFNPRAQSGVGAKGLGQFMDPTWKEWGKGRDVFDPEANISAQCLYMRWLIDHMTTWECALAAYNWGIGNVRRIWQDNDWRQKLPDETRNYLARIDKYYEEYTNGNNPS